MYAGESKSKKNSFQDSVLPVQRSRSKSIPVKNRQRMLVIQLCRRRIFVDGKEVSIQEIQRESGLLPVEINFYFESLENGHYYFNSWAELRLKVRKGSSITMEDIAKNHGYSMEKYKAIPDPKKQDIVDKFNGRLQEISSLSPVEGPFTVYIVVGELGGFGDISAGAKLAVALDRFYRQYKKWEGVKVQLKLVKLERLIEEESDASEKPRIKMVRIPGGKGKKGKLEEVLIDISPKEKKQREIKGIAALL